MTNTPAAPAVTNTDLIFDTLIPVWEDGLNIAEKNKDDRYQRGWLWADFWKAGNTLDAAIDYFVTSKRTSGTYTDVDKNVKTWTAADLVSRSYQFIFDTDGHRFGEGPWRDDYGWWGIAFVNAVRNASSLGAVSMKDKCLAAAKTCWQILYRSAQENLAYGSTDPDQFRIVRGSGFCCWNSGSAREFDAAHGLFSGVPNTVTTCGFWALTVALFELPESTDAERQTYLSVMKQLTTWFISCWQWPAPPAYTSNMLFNSCGLIRETPDPGAHRVWCYDEDRAWSADQGVALYCFVETIKALSSDRNFSDQVEILRSISKILMGGIRFLWSDRGDGPLYLHEFETKPLPVGRDSNLSNYNNNYITGPGVLVRYIARAIPTLEKMDDKAFSNFALDARAMFAHSRASAWANREDNNRILCWWMKFAESPYFQYEEWDKSHNTNDPAHRLWILAPQVSGLDGCVANDKYPYPPSGVQTEENSAQPSHYRYERKPLIQ